jgi:DNA-binding transcriptional ArsR family regulator
VDVLEVVAEPTRRRVLDLLRGGEAPVTELAASLGLAQPAASKHLRVLRDAGLVAVRVDGNRRLYRLDAAPLRAVDDWLAPFRRFWDDRLDALEAHLDASAAAEGTSTTSRGAERPARRKR